jgi:hypothetical protein
MNSLYRIENTIVITVIDDLLRLDAIEYSDFWIEMFFKRGG